MQWLIIAGLIGLVMLLALGMVSTARSQMRDAVRISNIKSIQAGLELHFGDQNTYPVVPGGIILGAGNTICLDVNGFSPGCVSPRPYMPNVPREQFNAKAPFVYSSRLTEPQACTVAPCASYALQFNLERAHPGLAKGWNCARPEGITAGACPQ